MKANYDISRAALAAIFSLTLLVGCGDPGAPADADSDDVVEAGGLLQALDLMQGGVDLVELDPEVDRYVVDVSVLVTAVTLRAVAADAGTAIRASVDGQPLPLFDDEGSVRLTGSPTTVEVAAVSGERIERYAIEISRGEQPLTETYVKAPRPEADARFGQAVAVDGDTLVVGAFDGTAVFVYTEDRGEWRSSAKLRGDNTQADESFGASVAIDGDTVVIGAPGDSSGVPVSGAVHVFVRTGSAWVQQATIKSVAPEIRAQFGASVDISGNTIVVGAPGEAGVAGGAYTFSRVGSEWLFQGALASELELRAGDAFGHAVAIENDVAVVTAPGNSFMDRDGNKFPDSGAAYVFTRVGQVWSYAEALKGYYDGLFERSPRANGAFGTSVDILEDAVVVGASGEGRVYIIELGEGSLVSRTESMSSPGSDDEDGFGASVSADGDFLVVGASGDDRGDPGLYGNDAVDSGAVFLYSRVSGAWAIEGYLKASNQDASDRFFGAAVDGGTLAVGATGEDGDGADLNDDSVVDSGAVYVFR